MRGCSPCTPPGTAGICLLVSWAAMSCTLTTNLDFVGPPLESSTNNQHSTEPGTPDAGAGNSSSALVGASSSSVAAIDAAVESSSAGTSTSAAESTTTRDDSRQDASVIDASALDASTPDASPLDSALPDASPDDCVPATTLLVEGYEGDLTKWSAVNWQSTQCQQTDIATDIAVESAHSIRSRIECSAESDHLHFTSLQLVNDTNQLPPRGPYAPFGFVLSFSAWLSVGYDFEADTWLDFLRFTGSCDRADPPGDRVERSESTPVDHQHIDARRTFGARTPSAGFPTCHLDGG